MRVMHSSVLRRATHIPAPVALSSPNHEVRGPCLAQALFQEANSEHRSQECAGTSLDVAGLASRNHEHARRLGALVPSGKIQ